MQTLLTVFSAHKKKRVRFEIDSDMQSNCAISEIKFNLMFIVLDSKILINKVIFWPKSAGNLPDQFSLGISLRRQSQNGCWVQYQSGRDVKYVFKCFVFVISRFREFPGGFLRDSAADPGTSRRSHRQQ